MQSWSWSDRGSSHQPAPAPTPLPPSQTLCMLRSSSRKKSYRFESLVPPGEGKNPVLITKLNSIQRSIYLWTIHMTFTCFFFFLSGCGKWRLQGVCSAQFQSCITLFGGLIVLFSLLSWVPDVHISVQTLQKETVDQALSLQHHFRNTFIITVLLQHISRIVFNRNDLKVQVT